MRKSEVRFLRMGWIASKLGLALVCQSEEERVLAAEHKLEVSQFMGFREGGGPTHYEKDALILEERMGRYRVGLVRAGTTGTSSPFGEDALPHREFVRMLDSIDKALHFTKEEARRQYERVKVVTAPTMAGTNIDAKSKEMYEWIRTLAKDGTVLTKEGLHRLALFSCFADGDPTVALCDVCECVDADEWKIRPLLIVPTAKMVLTDHEGKPSTPTGGSIDA